MDNNIEQLFALFDDFIDSSDVLHSKLMAQISSAIIKERLKLRMTQSQFATHIDVKQSLISRWEQGNYNFSLKKLSEIATKLNLDVNIMFCNISEHKPSDYYSQPFLTTKIIHYSDKKTVCSESPEFYSKTFSNQTSFKKEDLRRYVTIC